MNNHPFKFPKIGIRPTIDGRLGGVRESLEDSTMAMAHSLADLYTANLRNLDGSPVECVIADTNIGGVREAAACEEKFQREGVGLSVTVTPCWCYGSETMDMDPHRPKAVWGFNGTERPGAVPGRAQVHPRVHLALSCSVRNSSPRHHADRTKRSRV